MKKFFINLLLFLILATGICFMFSMIKLPDEYIIYKTKNTSYEKIAWNLELINKHPERINGSALIFGPSLVQAGVCDSLLTAENIPAINFGTNGGGNEVQLYFLKRTLQFKPASVFLHVTKTLPRDLHNMTPLLYDPVTLLQSGQAFNFAFLNYFLKRAGYGLDYLVSKLMRDNKPETGSPHFGMRGEGEGYGEEQYNGFDYNTMQAYFEATNLHLKDFKLQAESERKGPYYSLLLTRRKLIHQVNSSDLLYNADTQQRFRDNAFKLCENSNTDVHFFYIPVIADVKTQEEFNPDFYFSATPHQVISTRKVRYLDRAEYWADLTHLSEKGAIVFTREMINENNFRLQKQAVN